jgi:hypothetical protein
VEGKVGRAHFVDSAGIALPQRGKQSQQNRLVILCAHSILSIHVLLSLKVPAGVSDPEFPF